MPAEGEILREARRVLSRLSKPGAHLRSVGGGFGLFVARNRYRKPVAVISEPVMRNFLSRELVTENRPAAEKADGLDGVTYTLSDLGRAHLRRLAAGGDNPHAEQHRLMAFRTVSHPGGFAAETLVNEGESPIGWLRSRKAPNGKPLLSGAAYDAAERLREDFTLARLMPRVTTDWSLAPGAAPRRRGADAALAVTEASMAARQRVRKALDAVGPGLADALVQVCCHLKGLEQAERDLNWPRRSGKLVLSMALERLAVHYGMGRKERG
jgi:hypothetical protein